MMNLETIKNQFEKLEHRLNGLKDHPVHQVRKSALAFVEQKGFPTRKDEEWRFTDLRPLLETQFQLPEPQVVNSLSEQQVKSFTYSDFNGPQLVFVNGFFALHLSIVPQDQGEIRITSIGEELKNGNQKVLEEVSVKNVVESNIFSALNTAFFTDGVVIEIPDETVLKAPINILHLTYASGVNPETAVRHILKVGKNSFVRLIETYRSFADEAVGFTNALVTFNLSENAQVIHSKVQYENLKSFHLSNTFVVQQQNSRYVSNNIALGGRLVRNNINITLSGRNADAVLNGLYMGHGHQHIDNHTLIDHAVPECTSNELYQGILNDRSTAVFAGKILVRPDAQKTDAVQANNCLLLSEEAVVDTMPQLEIYADDVKCTHGATVGQLDEDAIFYLRSRGIGEQRAKNLLIYSFAERIIEQIKVDSVREVVDDLLLQRFREDMNFSK